MWKGVKGCFVTIFEGFFNDFRDFLAESDKNLTMAGKAVQERSCLRRKASAGKPLEEQPFGL